MLYFPHTIILRHQKENLRKCSLRGLESREDLTFLTYPKDFFPDLPDYILLTLDAPPLSPEDSGRGLFILDGTWRYAAVMLRKAPTKFITRSIPSHFRTAYPRRQDDERGLASVEALFLAYHILGRDTSGLLDHYYWREKFFELNGFLGNLSRLL